MLACLFVKFVGKMESRALYINVTNATDLENVRRIKFKKMNVYVVVSITGDSNSRLKQETLVHEKGGTNPTWNQNMHFILKESAARSGLLTLEFRLLCERSLGGDREIGAVRVPVRALLVTIGVPLELRRGVLTASGRYQGELTFSYKFGEIINDPFNQPPPPLPGVNPHLRPRKRHSEGYGAKNEVAEGVTEGVTEFIDVIDAAINV